MRSTVQSAKNGHWIITILSFKSVTHASTGHHEAKKPKSFLLKNKGIKLLIEEEISDHDKTISLIDIVQIVTIPLDAKM
ncbi:hypothetical protein C5167_018519 [Papaver somniferum]|uniref:Uncharacterized protein n=1 Tax=Papaver somniferum TaxID=3469 RepID=A0A4Y7IRN5_PAPSO|nr:hypothetical protein C5167_018519 [Papaver somniferum]